MRSPFRLPKCTIPVFFFYLFITVNKLDYDQIMDKLQYVRSKVDEKMNASEIVKSVYIYIYIYIYTAVTQFARVTVNNYSLKSRGIVAKYLPSHEVAR